MYEIYYDTENGSYLLITQYTNPFLVTSTSILIASITQNVKKIKKIYNKIIKEHHAKISNIT